jgi:hypothetical protein
MNTNRFLKLTALTLVLCTVMGLFSSCCCFVPAGLFERLAALLEERLPPPSEGNSAPSLWFSIESGTPENPDTSDLPVIPEVPVLSPTLEEEGNYDYFDVMEARGNCPEAFETKPYIRCEYDPDDPTESPSAWEFWPYLEFGYQTNDSSRFHLCIVVDPTEFDFSEGLTSSSDEGESRYTWRIFYNTVPSSQRYSMIECAPWSYGTYGDGYIYRLPVMDYGMKPFKTGTYNFIFIVYDEEGDPVCWFEEMITWNGSSQKFYEDAVKHGCIYDLS